MAAQNLYQDRLHFLRSEIKRVVKTGRHMGKEYEEETMEALDWIEEEVDGIDECLRMLYYLLRR